MNGTLRDGVVRVGGDARQRFYDSSGYGRPTGEGVALAPVEAAHLLFRDDLDAVDGMGLRSSSASKTASSDSWSTRTSASAGSTSRPHARAGSTLPTVTISMTPPALI